MKAVAYMKHGMVMVLLIYIVLNGLNAQPKNRDTVAIEYDLQDVVVTAQYAPTDSRNAIHDIQTIKREVIEQRGVTNLEQLLQQHTSVRIDQDAVLGSSVSLLGIDGQKVKIMVDGVPVIGRQNGNIDLSQISLHNIERVEIVEGPLAVNYGTDALGGVINLISKKSQLESFSVKASTQLESRGENRCLAQIGVRLKERWNFILNTGYDHFDGYSEDTLRSVIWNPKEQLFADAYLGYRFKNEGVLSFQTMYFDEEVTNLGNVRRPQFKPYAFDDYYHTQRTQYTLHYKGNISEHLHLQSTASYNHYERQKQSLQMYFEDGTQEEVEGQQDTSAFSGVMWRCVLASQYPNSSFNYQIGIDLRHDDATGKRIQDSLSNKENFSQISDYALFASLRYQPFERLKLETGLRYAYNTRYNAPLVPSIHAKYDFNAKWSLRASYSQGFRSPDLKELFFNFIDINHFIIGNPGLKAEYSNNYQLGFHYRHRKDNSLLDFKCKAFYNHIKDKIELYEFVTVDGEISPAIDTSTLQYTYFNLSDYKTHGSSLSFGYSANGLELNTTTNVIAYYQPEYEMAPEETDPYTYTIEISNSISYTLKKQQLNFALYLRNNDKQVSYYSDTDDDGSTIFKQRFQDGFTMADFTCTKYFWQKHITLSAGVKNLLDVQRANIYGGSAVAHTESNGTALVGTGRNYFTKLAINLGW